MPCNVPLLKKIQKEQILRKSALHSKAYVVVWIFNFFINMSKLDYLDNLGLIRHIYHRLTSRNSLKKILLDSF